MILGGGIAGLWTLARLRQQGYNAVLLETEALGAGQTRYAQGIIHGGTKYALTGKLTASSEAVSEMPSIWRACLEGKGEIDLQQAILISDAHYLWSTGSLASKITGFFASKVMRARTMELEPHERPGIFQHKDFKGNILRLDEPVFDTLSVLRAIASPVIHAILNIKPGSISRGPGSIEVDAADGTHYRFSCKKLVLMAGQGNADLIQKAGLSAPAMQLRPLKMVMMRGGLSEKVFAHCMGAGINPRITITSHTDTMGNIVWYLGGELAEEGVNRSDEEQIAMAKKEVASLIPWQSLDNTEWAVLDIDRAEVRHPDGHRPDTCHAEQHDNVIVAWPTKLALAPLLAQQIADMFEADKVEATTGELPTWPEPRFADYPWCEEARWN